MERIEAPSSFRWEVRGFSFAALEDQMVHVCRRLPIILLVSLLVFVVCSCASNQVLMEKLQKADATYQELVTPASIPVSLAYKPAEFKLAISTIKFEENKTVEEWGAITGKVSEIGESLIWEYKFLSYGNSRGAHFSPSLPMVEFKFLTDKRGNVREKEIAYPYFQQAKIPIKESERLHLEESLSGRKWP